MADRRLLPHLADACMELLGADVITDIPPGVRSSIAGKAGVSQNTVDRFLKGETVPRSQDLDTMVTTIADRAGKDWLVPWRSAVRLAKRSNTSEREPSIGEAAGTALDQIGDEDEEDKTERDL